MSPPISWPLIPPASPTPAAETPLGFSALAYARQLKELLPPGLVWLLGVDSVISKTLHAIATEFARIDARGLDLLEEADPRTTDELLEDWERVLGLPDGCVPTLPALDSDRRFAIAQKLTTRGGQSRAFFVASALSLGFTSTIEEFWDLPLRVGFRCGDRCYGIEWVHVWQMDTINAAALGVTFILKPVATSAVRQDTINGILIGADTHKYKVTAHNDQGETLASNVVSVIPGGVTNTNVNRISWNAVAGATYFSVFANRNAGLLGNPFAPLEWIGDTVGAPLFYDDHGGGIPTGLSPSVTTASITPYVDRVLSFECIMRRASPAHSIVLFQYSNPI